MSPKRHRSATEAPPPFIVAPTGVYSAAQVRQLLGLARSTLSTEIARGRLRVSRRAGRYWFTGAWILEWLESGERKRTSRPGRNGVSLPVSPAKEGGS